MAKGGPATVALSLGQTSNAMWANLIRGATLPLAFLAVYRTGSVMPVVWAIRNRRGNCSA